MFTRSLHILTAIVDCLQGLLVGALDAVSRTLFNEYSPMILGVVGLYLTYRF